MAAHTDYEFESADALASATTPVKAGQIKKGGYLMIRGKPCKVLSVSVCKAGKHGHAKCTFTACDMFTGKKLESSIQSHHDALVPVVRSSDWDILDIDGDDGNLTLLDEAGNQKTDLNLPGYPAAMAEGIRENWAGGDNAIVVTVKAFLDIEQVVAWKKMDYD